MVLKVNSVSAHIRRYRSSSINQLVARQGNAPENYWLSADVVGYSQSSVGQVQHCTCHGVSWRLFWGKWAVCWEESQGQCCYQSWSRSIATIQMKFDVPVIGCGWPISDPAICSPVLRWPSVECSLCHLSTGVEPSMICLASELCCEVWLKCFNQWLVIYGSTVTSWKCM